MVGQSLFWLDVSHVTVMVSCVLVANCPDFTSSSLILQLVNWFRLFPLWQTASQSKRNLSPDISILTWLSKNSYGWLNKTSMYVEVSILGTCDLVIGVKFSSVVLSEEWKQWQGPVLPQHTSCALWVVSKPQPSDAMFGKKTKKKQSEQKKKKKVTKKRGKSVIRKLWLHLKKENCWLNCKWIL